jgi:predicted  nucleic acid-binding Zn-ribbon protein
MNKFAFPAFAMLGAFFLAACSGSASADQILNEYSDAVDVYLAEMDVKQSKIGDFSFEDKTWLDDITKVEEAKTILEVNFAATKELYDSMKSKVNDLKQKYQGSDQTSPDLQTSYDALMKDFQDIQTLEADRSNALIAYYTFIKENINDIEISDNTVTFKSGNLTAQYNALDKTASEKQMNYDDDQSAILDRHESDIEAFSKALASY